jgi:hypothetical protein
MSITRRSVLKGVLSAAAAASAGMVRAVSVPSVSMVVYDGRLPNSRSLHARHTARAIDVADEHASRWRNLRAHSPKGRVVGLTTWSDFVLARGFLEEKGKRLRTEVRCGKLFYWEMT